MKKKYIVYNESNHVVDVLTLTNTTDQFCLLRSTYQQSVELFVPVESMKPYFVDTLFTIPYIITLN